MPKLPVVAAITNYNMAKELERLLPQVVKQGYDEIFVLDDGSRDNSRDVAARFEGVKVVAGETNKGAGGNRNRIIGELKQVCLIHFLDADVDLETGNTAELVRKVAPEEPFGFVGGLVKTKAGQPMAWNYGAGPWLSSSFGSQVQFLTFHRQDGLARATRLLFKKLLADWPDPKAPPKRRQVYWCAEANIVFRSDIFKEMGGFDENYRETEILEFALRCHNRGLKSYFDPRLSVRHTEGKVREYNRDALKVKELIRTSRKLGFRRWLLHKNDRV